MKFREINKYLKTKFLVHEKLGARIAADILTGFVLDFTYLGFGNESSFNA